MFHGSALSLETGPTGFSGNVPHEVVSAATIERSPKVMILLNFITKN